jgi:O-antigen/teichoic acid export membrane protein
VITLFGEKWAPSVLPLAIMSLGMIFRMTTLQFKTVMVSMRHADLSLKSNAMQLLLLLPLTMITMNYGVLELIVAWVATEFFVMLAMVQMGKRALDISFLRLLKCYRPALVSSTVMAISVMGIKFLLGNKYNLTVLLTAITVGLISYYLATRFLFPNQFAVAFKVIFGVRLKFLAPRSL